MGGCEPVIIEDLAKDTHLSDLQTNMTNISLSCNMSFDNIMELFAHEIEMHPLTSWYEEEDGVPPCSIGTENMISDILMIETPNLEMMLNEDFNMDLLTPEDDASKK